MATSATISLAQNRLIRLRNPLTNGGFTHKIIVLFGDINQQSVTSNLTINLPLPQRNCVITRAGLYTRQLFLPITGLPGGTQNPALSGPSVVGTGVFMKMPSLAFITQYIDFAPTTGGTFPDLNAGGAALTLYTGTSNFNAITAGELWLLMTLVDINLMN